MIVKLNETSNFQFENLREGSSNKYLKFTLSVAFLWIFIFTTYLLVSLLKYNYFFYIFAFFLISFFQYLLIQALHEAWHFYFKNKLLSLFFLSYPLLLNSNARKNHFAHHKYFGQENLDPDYIPLPKSKKEFINYILISFTGYYAFKRFLFLMKINKVESGEKKNNIFDLKKLFNSDNFSFLIVQIIFISFFYLIGLNLFFYIFLWFVPLITLTRVINCLRLMSEHSLGYNENFYRSFENNDLITKFFGAYGFDRHAEHHLVPYLKHTDLYLVSNKIKNTSLNSSDSENQLIIEFSKKNHLQVLFDYYKKL